MKTSLSYLGTHLAILCRGEADPMADWLNRITLHRVLCCCGIIVAGCGTYGATLGLWRSPLQALYAGIKFPLLILLTVLANAGLNGMLAQVLGLGISIRQSSMAILMSFTLLALFLGAFAPISLFILHNTPPLSSPNAMLPHLFTKLTHVGIIAYAGIMANTRLYQLLKKLCVRQNAPRNILVAWLAGNLFLGAQLAWILRPFLGSPLLPVQFLRPDALNGNFYENLLQTLKQL